MVAADKGYQSVVEALLEGGVDVNYKHQVGYTGISWYNDYWMYACLDYEHRLLVGQQFSLQQRMVELVSSRSYWREKLGQSLRWVIIIIRS